MASLIAVGNTQTAFADGEFTVPAGKQIVLCIIPGETGGIPSNVEFELARKTSGSDYAVLMTLDATNIVDNGVIVGGAADITYAIRRMASSVSAGMDYA